MSPPVVALSPVLGRSLRQALALISPADCAGCGSPDIELCSSCRRELLVPPLVEALPDGTPLAAGLDYAGVARDVILAFKQQGRWRLARELGPALGVALRALGASPASEPSDRLVVLAVPSSSSGRRRRGYDPVELLLRAVGEVPARLGLRLLRSNGSQKSRSRSERLRSREGALRCSPWVAGRCVVIVDDVSTSGATLVEAVRAAREVGAQVVGVACLAATPLIASKAP